MNDGMVVYSTTTPPIFDTIAAHLYFFDEQKLNSRWSGRTKLPEGTRHVAYLVDVTSLGAPPFPTTTPLQQLPLFVQETRTSTTSTRSARGRRRRRPRTTTT